MTDYDCWCGQPTFYVHTVYCKWGQVDVFRCAQHGEFEVVDTPLADRGSQIR